MVPGTVFHDFCRLFLYAARERAVEALVEHQCLEHVAGYVRPSDPAHYAGASLAPSHQHDVAHARVTLRFARERDPVARLEQRLGHDQTAALGQDAHDGIHRTPLPAAHLRSSARTLSATGRALSLFSVFGLSLARTCALMPSFGSGSPFGR